MSRTRRPYAPEFRRQMVELVRGGRTPEALSREFEPTATTIRKWVDRAAVEEGLKEGETEADRDEVRRLRREIDELKLEREILKKAAAWFAQETGSVPSRRSSS